MMHIPVLNQLETRTEWISFFRMERPYVYLKHPLCLVDFQSTFLQITLLHEDMLDGRQATKYSLGSKSSMEPAWTLIKACHWQLSDIITGLESLSFSSNARDNAFLGIHTDLSVRKFFSKDKQLLAPSLIGSIEPLLTLPKKWETKHICQLLSHQQYLSVSFLPSPDKDAPIRSVILRLLESSSGWNVEQRDAHLILSYQNKPILDITPNLKKPTPRLKEAG